MIYSKVSIDYSKGVKKMPDGTLKGNKIGCFVMTLDEAEECLDRRRKFGDLRPELLLESNNKFKEEIRKIKAKE